MNPRLSKLEKFAGGGKLRQRLWQGEWVGRFKNGRARVEERAMATRWLWVLRWSETKPNWLRIFLRNFRSRKAFAAISCCSSLIFSDSRAFSWRRWNRCRQRRLFGRVRPISCFCSCSCCFLVGHPVGRPIDLLTAAIVV